MRSSGPIAASTAWLPLLYDTVAIGLTLYRTAKALYTKSAGQILRVMLQEGLLYYRYGNLRIVSVLISLRTLNISQPLAALSAQSR